MSDKQVLRTGDFVPEFNVSDSTLRLWFKAIEKAADRRFPEDGNGRYFRDSDQRLVRQFYKFYKQQRMIIADAAGAAVAAMKELEGAESEVAATTETKVETSAPEQIFDLRSIGGLKEEVGWLMTEFRRILSQLEHVHSQL